VLGVKYDKLIPDATSVAVKKWTGHFKTN